LKSFKNNKITAGKKLGNMRYNNSRRNFELNIKFRRRWHNVFKLNVTLKIPTDGRCTSLSSMDDHNTHFLWSHFPRSKFKLSLQKRLIWKKIGKSRESLFISTTFLYAEHKGRASL